MTISISIVATKNKAWQEKQHRVNHAKGFIVYLLRAEQSDGGIFKIGRTKNLTSRVQAYEAYLGSTVRCLVQIKMSSAQAAVELEAAFVNALKDVHLVRGREWFRMDYGAVGSFMTKILEAHPAGIISVHGMPAPVRSIAADLGLPNLAEYCLDANPVRYKRVRKT